MSSNSTVSLDPKLDRYRLNPYDPSIPAAVIFLALFGITALWHTWQCITRRTWFFLPLVVAAWLQAIGYVTRIVSAKNMTELMPYVISTFFILCSPALMAASIYIILGRIIVFVNGEHHSLVKVTRLTKTFVAGDVFSLLLQAGGGGLLSAARTNKSMADIGGYVIIGGLFIQIIFFGLFITTSFLFNQRIIREPTKLSTRMLDQPYGKYSWLTMLRVLYIASGFIMVRSIFRVVEYIQGRDGYLATHEVYFYCLDALMMVPAVYIFNFVHPAQVMPVRKGAASASEIALHHV
ncbi:RTA1 like protein-domain-containing protein [Flagelloscypha sp. PMI_526]|nr:RTA1 like protein-domain-containing protein [Flagelloscypha sp. PMI_526]